MSNLKITLQYNWSLFRNWLQSFVKKILRPVNLKAQAGQAIVEYALLIALIALVAIGILVLLAPTVTSVFNGITGSIAGNCGDPSFVAGQPTPTPAACNINNYPAP